MPRLRTAAAIISEARTLADCVNDPHITDAESLVWVAQALAELWDMLVIADPTWHLEDSTITVSDSTVREYNPPNDVHSVLALDFEPSDNERYPVERFSFADRTFGILDNAVRTTGGPTARWRYLRNDTDGGDARIVFDRNPDLGTYRLWYVETPPGPADLTTASNIDGVSGWEDFITLTLAIQMRDKQESDTAVLQAKLNRIIARIEAMAANRDAGEDYQVIDTYRRELEIRGPLRR